MKYTFKLSAALLTTILSVSCTLPSQNGANQPQQQAGNAVYNDPNNPYAVPGGNTQGSYAPPAQNPSYSAPYQPIPAAPVNPPANTPTYTPPQPAAPSYSGGTTHTVVSGDSLWGISRKYGVSVDDIRQANNIQGDLIRTGQSLIIPK